MSSARVGAAGNRPDDGDPADVVLRALADPLDPDGLDPDGLDPVRDVLAELWPSALERLEHVVEQDREERT